MTNDKTTKIDNRTTRSAHGRGRRAGGWVALSVLLSACGGGNAFSEITPDEIFNIGLQAYQAEQWSDAIDAFESVLLTPAFTRAPEARLYMAKAYYGDEKFILARSEYQRVLDRYPADTVAPHASLGVCEAFAMASPILQRDQTATQNAWQNCSNVARDYAGTLVGLRAAELQLGMYDKLAEADYLRGKHYYKRGLYDSALIFFEDVIEQFPDSEWAPWAMYEMTITFDRIGYTVDAEEFRQRLTTTYPSSEAAKLVGGNPQGGAGAAAPSEG